MAVMCAAAILACVFRVCKSRGLVVPELNLKVPSCNFLQSGSELEASFYRHRVQSVRAMRRRARRWRMVATGLLFIVMSMALLGTELKGGSRNIARGRRLARSTTAPNQLQRKSRRPARKPPAATARRRVILWLSLSLSLFQPGTT